MSRAEKQVHYKNKFKTQTDFSKVGGLSNHLQILRDTIIVPLLHNNVYTHFNIKAPRGILFYGPPGTGKTLVAGALATEINREGFGKVAFYQRKGADVLDKWVGESEKKLRALFDQAGKTRPSIIFFDELDGLAPIRSGKNDHVHCSIVTTLLALMDGLDSMPGVIVIGATNRIESVDPALRRPGRFDRELYFPLPCTDARKEILQVHMHSWSQKPSIQFVESLADNTAGFCGSDLQALCAETLLCAIKRNHPNVGRYNQKNKIEASELTIEECDFLKAQRRMIPSSRRLGNKMRKLSKSVAPLLQRQLEGTLARIRMLWPHFFAPHYKYLIGNERYAGRVILVGSNLQGVSKHLVPAILQNFEHLPSMVVDCLTLSNNEILSNFCQVLPSILVIPRIDEMWTFIETHEQNFIVSMLEDVHSALPILIIVTYEEQLPVQLQNVFFNNTTAIICVENPTEGEVGDFFVPLFFGEYPSLMAVLHQARKSEALRNCDQRTNLPLPKSRMSMHNSHQIYKIKEHPIHKRSRSKTTTLPNNANVAGGNNITKKDCIDLASLLSSETDGESQCTLCSSDTKRKCMSLILMEMLHRGEKRRPYTQINRRTFECCRPHGDSRDVDKVRIYNMWRRTVHGTSKDLPLAQLEVIYDTIAACISIHRDNFKNLLQNLDETLHDIETSNEKHMRNDE